MKKKLTCVTVQNISPQTLVQFNRLINLEQMGELTQYAYARNSLLAMTKDWNLFVEFCHRCSVTAVPASVTAVRLFLENEAKARKYNTIRRYSVTISLIHRLLMQKDPTTNAKVRQSLSLLRIEKKGDQQQATSFTSSHLISLYENFHNDTSTKMIRDLAIYHVMFECALKRSELKQFALSQIQSTSSNTTLKFGQSAYCLSDNGHACLTKWLTQLNDNHEIVFRSIDRHGNISNKKLDDSSIFRILRNAGKLLDKPELKFSGQSARIGAVKELSAQGYKAKHIQDFGRWLSPAMPYQYLGDVNSAEQEKLKFYSFKPWE